MKATLITVKKAAQAAWLKVCCAGVALATLLSSGQALALAGKDWTTDNTAGTKKVTDVANNLDTASQSIAALLIQFVTVGGFVVVAISLYQLYKASKDEREKPMSAVVGLFIGGAMAAVGTIMWIMKNTVIG